MEPQHTCPEESAYSVLSTCGEAAGMGTGEIVATVAVVAVLVGAGFGLWYWLRNRY